MLLEDSLSYAAYKFGWTAVRRMPERQAYAAFQLIADRTWAARGKGVTQYERNLRRVLPAADDEEIRSVSREGLRSYMRYWCDAFRMPDWSVERTMRFTVENEEILEAALERHRGVIILAPHSGNYDHAAAWMNRAHAPVTTVAERLKPEKLFEEFVAFRARSGLEIIPFGTKGVLEMLERRLRDGLCVALLGDRDLSRHGVPVTFFGEATKMPAGPILLGWRTGAPVLPVGFWYDGEVAAATVLPPLEFPEGLTEEEAVAWGVQRGADALAELIRRRPHNWHMLQKLWLADLDPAKAPRDGAE